MHTGKPGRKKLPDRYLVQINPSKTKGDRYVLSHRDRGYIATLNNEEEVDRRIAMEEVRR
jgi:hypothetical protein